MADKLPLADLALVGTTSAGKSTLANAILGRWMVAFTVQETTRGTIDLCLDSRAPRERRGRAQEVGRAAPLVGSSEQAFQFIQEFTGFFTPGITVIFLLGLFWKRANEAGAIAAAVSSVVLSWVLKETWASLPFMNRMGVVFLVAAALAIVISLLTRARPGTDTIETRDVVYATRTSFNVGAIAVVLILIALYATWW
jgi:hypothetical protein